MATLLRHQIFVPIGLLLALAAAIGVWFIPLNPERRATTASTGQAGWQQRIAGGSGAAVPGVSPSSAAWNPPRPAGLAAFAPSLAALRPPPPEPPATVEVPDTPDDFPEVTVTPPVVALEWDYQGSIVANNTRAAMLMIDGRQRFLFEGESIANPDDPSGDRITVVSIQPTMVIAETRGVQIRLPLSSLTTEQRSAILAGGSASETGTGPRTIAPPRAASAQDIQRQRAATATRNQPTRTTTPARAAPGIGSNAKPGQPQQPTRTPSRQQAQPVREQPAPEPAPSQRREN